MKKVIALLLVLTLVCGLAGCGQSEPTTPDATATPAAVTTKLDAIKAAGVLTVATSPDYAPYEFLDPTKSGQEAIVGADIEVAKYIAEYIGVELELQAMDFDSCQTAVYTGKVDMAISGFAVTEERQQNANLSNTYKFDSTKQGIIVKKEDASKYTSAADFAGKKIAAQNGALQQTMVTEQTPDAILEMVADTNTGLMMLLSGKVDGFATSDDVGNVQIEQNPSVAFSDFWFEYEDQGTVVLMKKGEDDLTTAVNEALAKAEAEGKLGPWLADATALSDSLK